MMDEIRRIRSNVNHVALRGRLTLIDNKKSIQIQQNEIFAGQTKSDIPAPQQYGFESAPLIGADTINLNRGGSLESGWVVMTYDGRYKPLDLKDGDTIVYTKRDASQDKVHRIKFDAESGEILVETDELVNIKCKNANIEVEENTTLTSKTADITIAETTNLTCPTTNWVGDIYLTGNIIQTGAITSTADHKAGTISLMGHLHPGDGGTGSGPNTGAPIP